MWLSRHRGPFQFCVTRTTMSKKGAGLSNQWLTGLVDGADVEDDAKGLLDDPRDTIVCVDVWSVTEQQFVMTFRGRNTHVEEISAVDPILPSGDRRRGKTPSVVPLGEEAQRLNEVVLPDLVEIMRRVQKRGDA
jgi:hypothetical protein